MRFPTSTRCWSLGPKPGFPMGNCFDLGALPRRAMENELHGGAMCTKWALQTRNSYRTLASIFKSYLSPNNTSHNTIWYPNRAKLLANLPTPEKTSTKVNNVKDLKMTSPPFKAWFLQRFRTHELVGGPLGVGASFTSCVHLSPFPLGWGLDKSKPRGGG